MAELIVFQDDRKVYYFDECEHSVDIEEKKCVISVEKGLQIVITDFSTQKFSIRKNIFCSFSSEKDFEGFALIFSNQDDCQTLFDAFFQLQKINGMVFYNFFQAFEKFLNLFCNEIKSNKSQTLIKLVPKILDLLTDEESYNFNDVLTEQKVSIIKQDISIVPSPSATPLIKEEEQPDLIVINQWLKREPICIIDISDDEEEVKEEQQNPTISLNNNDSVAISINLPKLGATPAKENGRRILPNRKRKYYSLNETETIDDNSSDEEFSTPPPKRKRGRPASKHLNGEIVKAPGFKLTQTQKRGRMVEKLIVFCSHDSSLYYEYTQQDCKKRTYYCSHCRYNKNKNADLQLFKDVVNGDYVKLNTTPHKCQPQKYVPSEYVDMDSSVEAPNATQAGDIDHSSDSHDYKIEERNASFFMNSTISTIHQETTSSTTHRSNDNEVMELDVSASSSTHTTSKPACISFPTKIPRKAVKLIGKFKLDYFTKDDGSINKHLTVYDPVNEKLCYDFFCLNHSNRFQCAGCKQKKKTFKVKLYENKAHEVFIEYGKIRQHVCVPQPEPTIIRSPDIIVEKDEDGVIENLVIMDSKNKNLCYEFYLLKENRFLCYQCNKIGRNFLNYTLFENENGEYYVKMGRKPHVCQPVKFSRR